MKSVSMAFLLILGGMIPLVGALVSQYGFGYHPCHFCLLQRYPYLVVIAAGVVVLGVRRRALMWQVLIAVSIYALLVTAVLGLIHTGIEAKFLTYTGGCVGQAAADGSLAALRAAIASAPLVACDQATAMLFGLSMATWNVLWAAGVIVLIFLRYRYDRRDDVCQR
jgi:disulfide bond formation protein DsbB